jgi:uncharacterized phage infection (PIP) family protein YhgE
MSDVRVRVTAQNETRTGFQQALGDARKFGQEARKSIGGGLGGIGAEIRSSLVGALAGIGIGQFVRSTFEQFGRINDLSQQFGVSAETLQRFGQVASESGSNIEQVAVALSTLTRNVQAAKDGTGEQAEALQRLGLSAQQLGNIDAAQGLLKLADAFVASEDKQRAYADVLTIIGARQRNLIPLLQQGSAAILEQASQVSVASDEIIAKADEVGDRFARLGQQVTAGLGPVAATLGSIFLDAFESIKTRVQQLGGFITSALLAAGQAATGNFGVARDILSGAVDEWESLGEQFQKTRQDIWSEPPQSAARGMVPPEDMDITPGASSGQKSGTQKSNVTGKQLSPGSIEGIREFEREQEAARRALGTEFGPGTADAAAGGFRVDAADFARQQAEEAAKAMALVAPGGMTGSFGASQLQRIGFASNEFFDTRKEDPSKLMQQMVSEQKKTNKYLGDSDGLYLQPSS